MKTYWFCEHCRAVGVVEHDDHIDVMSALYLLGDAHRAVSPECTYGYRDLRVLNFTAILRASFEKDPAPEWAIEPLAKLIEEKE